MTEPRTVEQMIQAVATDPDSLPNRDDSIRQRAFIDIVSRSMMVVKFLARRTPDDAAEVARLMALCRDLETEMTQLRILT